MAMINTLTIGGRVTRDPEIKYLDSGKAVVKFAVAVDQRGKKKDDTDKTDFFDCEAWDKQAEFISQYVKKGSGVIVTGRFESRKHEGKTYWTLKVNEVDPFLASKGDGAGQGLERETEEIPF